MCLVKFSSHSDDVAVHIEVWTNHHWAEVESQTAISSFCDGDELAYKNVRVSSFNHWRNSFEELITLIVKIVIPVQQNAFKDSPVFFSRLHERIVLQPCFQVAAQDCVLLHNVPPFSAPISLDARNLR